MLSPSLATTNGLPNLQQLPLPILILSSDRTVLVATEVVKRLFGVSPGHPWHQRTFVGCSLTELGVSLAREEGCAEQDLDAVLDKIARKDLHAAGRTLHSSNLPGEGISRKRGREDLTLSSTVDDSVSDAWAEDAWEFVVDVQRGPPNGGTVRVKLSIRMWPANESALYVLTFAKPSASQFSANFSVQAQAAEKDLQQTNKHTTLNRLRSCVFDQSSIPSYLFSADETIYYPNEAGKALAGLVEEENMLEHGSQILPRLEVWDENYTRKLTVDEYPGIKLVRTRQSFKEHTYGFVYPHTGERLRLDVSGDCLYDKGNGEFLGGIVWCRNVTGYTNVIAQQQLEIERGFENKLDNMPNLAWTAKPDGEPDYFSQRWYDYTHANRDEIFKDIWSVTVHPDERDAMWDSWIRCTQSGQPFTIEARYKRFDGVYRYHLVHGVAQRNDDGEIVKWHGTCTDIHELVTRRIEANRLKQQMLDVLAHAEVNLFGFDTQMSVTMLEGSIKWGTQESAAEKAALVGNELVDIVETTTDGGAKGATDFIEAVQKILRGDSTMEILEHTVDKHWYRSRFIADLEPNNETGQDTIRGVLGLSIDITDMKVRAALELEKTQLVANELAAKEANMLKSQFLANVSHELRTPISGVLGMADLLAETPLADEQREYAKGISQSADSLLGIVNDILDASKIEAGRFDIESVEFNLSRVLEDLYKMMAYAAQRKGLQLDYKTNLILVERVIGDPGRTRQILVNLLTNAIKFTSKGTITLNVSAVEYQDTLTVVFTVEDTGIGIEDAVLRKLFTPFSQGDSSTARLFGGTGLGLTICKELATLMHGAIGLESTPHVGSKATFSVPFKRPPSRRSSKEIPEPADAPLHDFAIVETDACSDREARPLRRLSPGLGDGVFADGLTPDLSTTVRAHTQILVVEDNTINQNIAVQFIKKLGFPVQAVWNGKEALEYLENPTATTPRPHIVLMDCQMPIMDGYEATRKLRNSTDISVDDSLRKIPVIALTASAIKGDKEKCEAAGMDDYLIKPVRKKELERVLVKWALRSQKVRTTS